MNDGSSWSDAYTNLAVALSVAAAGEQVWVAAGTYRPGADRGASFRLVPGVSVYGGFRGDELCLEQRDWETYACILSGDVRLPGDRRDNCYHVVTGADNAVLDGFTITLGNANGTGLDEKVGAGVYAADSSPTLRNCLITGNHAGEYGAGLYAAYSSPHLENCVLTDNEAFQGGAAYWIGASPRLVNCTLVDNRAQSFYTLVVGMAGGTAELVNCILWNATVTGQDDLAFFAGATAEFAACTVLNSGGSGQGWNRRYGTDLGGNLDSDPLLDGDHRPLAGSPCIDRGLGHPAPFLDKGGNASHDDRARREYEPGAFRDIGAYEFLEHSGPAWVQLDIPEDGADDLVFPLDLTWLPVTATDDEPLTYEVEVAVDAGFSDVRLSRGGLEAPGSTIETGRLLTDYLLHWRVRALDGSGTSAWSRARSFTAVTNRPQPGDDTFETPEDTPLTIPLSELLRNDDDPDGDALQVTGHGPPAVAGAEVVMDADTVTYIPAPDFDGADWFTYTVTDPHGAAAEARVNVSVTPVNDPPYVHWPTVSHAVVGRAYSQELVAVDVDDPPGTLVLTPLELPPWLEFQDAGTPGVSRMSGTPNTAGEFPVSVRIQDPHGAETEADFALTVTDPAVVVYTLAPGWNLVSLPLTALERDPAPASVFVDSDGHSLIQEPLWTAGTQNAGYESLSHSDRAGAAVWVYSPEGGTTRTISGGQVTDKTWNLKAGWNLVGAWQQVQVGDLEGLSPGSRIWAWEPGGTGNYHLLDDGDTILNTQGVWVHSPVDTQVSFPLPPP
jgi:hypothetical protein